jgi:hypothetical protein
VVDYLVENNDKKPLNELKNKVFDEFVWPKRPCRNPQSQNSLIRGLKIQ